MNEKEKIAIDAVDIPDEGLKEFIRGIIGAEMSWQALSRRVKQPEPETERRIRSLLEEHWRRIFARETLDVETVASEHQETMLFFFNYAPHLVGWRRSETAAFLEWTLKIIPLCIRTALEQSDARNKVRFGEVITETAVSHSHGIGNMLNYLPRD